MSFSQGSRFGSVLTAYWSLSDPVRKYRINKGLIWLSTKGFSKKRQTCKGGLKNDVLLVSNEEQASFHCFIRQIAASLINHPPSLRECTFNRGATRQQSKVLARQNC